MAADVRWVDNAILNAGERLSLRRRRPALSTGNGGEIRETQAAAKPVDFQRFSCADRDGIAVDSGDVQPESAPVRSSARPCQVDRRACARVGPAITDDRGRVIRYAVTVPSVDNHNPPVRSSARKFVKLISADDPLAPDCVTYQVAVVAGVVGVVSWVVVRSSRGADVGIAVQYFPTRFGMPIVGVCMVQTERTIPIALITS